ncbi:hypothetical protein M5G11_27045, partial [Pseudomonas sp. TNT2022 ID681]
EVDMERNGGITDDDVADGSIKTCCSLPGYICSSHHQSRTIASKEALVEIQAAAVRLRSPATQAPPLGALRDSSAACRQRLQKLCKTFILPTPRDTMSHITYS